MRMSLQRLATLLAAGFFLVAALVSAAHAEKRIALVVGNSDYMAGPAKTSANDAGLIAQTLQGAGFEVIGARDLGWADLVRSIQDFVNRANAAGPDTVAFIYLAGYGMQFEGENYFLAADARAGGPIPVPVQAVRLSTLMQILRSVPLKASIVVLDAAREGPFTASAGPGGKHFDYAGGFALVEAEPRTLIAFNAAPGTVAPQSDEDYGAYALALSEVMEMPGLKVTEMFDQVRLRVHEETGGAFLPWDVSQLRTDFAFVPGRPSAGAARFASLRTRPIRSLNPRDAYLVALDRDTLQAYLEFLRAFPRDPMAKRVRAIVAARREAITWREARRANRPEAYWSYLRRYPRGPHAANARFALMRLHASLEPPSMYDEWDYEVEAPDEEEIYYIERPVIVFGSSDYGFAPPPQIGPQFGWRRGGYKPPKPSYQPNGGNVLPWIDPGIGNGQPGGWQGGQGLPQIDPGIGNGQPPAPGGKPGPGKGWKKGPPPLPSSVVNQPKQPQPNPPQVSPPPAQPAPAAPAPAAPEAGPAPAAPGPAPGPAPGLPAPGAPDGPKLPKGKKAPPAQGGVPAQPVPPPPAPAAPAPAPEAAPAPAPGLPVPGAPGGPALPAGKKPKPVQPVAPSAPQPEAGAPAQPQQAKPIPLLPNAEGQVLPAPAAPGEPSGLPKAKKPKLPAPAGNALPAPAPEQDPSQPANEQMNAPRKPRRIIPQVQPQEAPVQQMRRQAAPPPQEAAPPQRQAPAQAEPPAPAVRQKPAEPQKPKQGGAPAQPSCGAEGLPPCQ